MTRARARVGSSSDCSSSPGRCPTCSGARTAPATWLRFSRDRRCSSSLYISLLPPSPWLPRRGPAAVVIGLALLPLLAIVLLLGGAPQSFAALFVYFAAAVGMLLPAYAAMASICATAFGIGVTGAVHGIGSGSLAATVLTVVAIGMMMSRLRPDRPGQP